jgi:membrane protease YdiL (CAAX protease family)
MGRIRWRWLLVCLGLSVLALLATLVVSALLPSAGDAGEVGGHLNHFTSTTFEFALVILFLTPLQAAGEEYAFRGYLTQAVGGLFRWRWLAVVVPALLFALAHGIGQDVPVFFDRFAFGLVAGVLVIATGGLEAGIAMHVLNNFLAFGLALLFGDMTDTLNASGGSWWMIPSTLTQSLVYLALVLLVARRLGIATRTSATPAEGPTVLVGQTPSV